MTEAEIMLKKSTTDLYFKLLECGLESIISDYNERGFKRAIEHLDSMVSYFENEEDYEKCTTLKEFLSLTVKIHSKNNKS